MMPYKKILIYLGIIAILTPIGIILPEYFKSGKAWGEWSPKEVHKKTGKLPEGMSKNAGKYKAPLPDYNNGEENSIKKKSYYYLLSGILGAGIILGVSSGINKIINKK